MNRPRRSVLLLYGSAIFLSSFLLFLIQPIFAKLILPWFGGTAAVWTTCLVFFQVALLAGYFYAYAIVQRVSPKGQAMLHVALLAASLLLLPVIPGSAWKPSGSNHPAASILLLLTAASLVVHGYHPFAEDAEIYLPGIEKTVDRVMARKAVF